MSMTVEERDALVEWRRHLHTMPEVSGDEHGTAHEIIGFLSHTQPDGVIAGLGGTGIAVIYHGNAPGPTVAIRAELDALPIAETGTPEWRSRIPGKGHMCGHDGHMAILAAVGMALGHKRPERGRAILLFQPAEETGAGAAAMIADHKFIGAKPDITIALHNMPGAPLGEIWIKDGTAACASLGLKIIFSGRTAHASLPQTGRSPAPAIAKIVPALTALSHGSLEGGDLTLATVTHIAVGEPTFGVAPGHGELWVTLRTQSDAAMADLRQKAEALALQAAEEHGLAVTFSEHDVFRASVNDPEAAALVRKAAEDEGLGWKVGETMRASEDFGRFADVSKSALLFLGAGTDHPALHNPDYDFPDELIPVGARLFLRVIHNVLG